MRHVWTVAWTRPALALLAVLIGLRLLLPWYTLRQMRTTRKEVADALLASQEPKPPSVHLGGSRPTFGAPAREPWQSQVDVGAPARGPWQAQVEIMLSRMDAIGPEPLGLRRDGAFNEPFDDYPAFAEKGLTTDAHDAIGGMRDGFVATAASATIGETQYAQLREFGPGALSHLGVDLSKLPSPREIIARKERCLDIAGLLIDMKLKARCAQLLGLMDLLIGITVIALLAGGAAWFAARPRGPGGVELA